ncbi:MAG TPA: hypothetical protein V6D21_17065 [Candidatus Obscuribacterales bacterium]
MNPLRTGKYSYSLLGSFLLVSPILLSQFSSVPVAPKLTFPPPSNILDNGCLPPLENDIVWVFAWSEIPNATAYHLYVIGANAVNPVINNSNLPSPDYISKSSGYIADQNLIGWKWKVRAMVNGEWGSWSPEQMFDVEPLNTDCLENFTPPN